MVQEPWGRLGTVIDRAPTVADLRSHALQYLAADHWRTTGQHVPPEFAAEELLGEALRAGISKALVRVREACDSRVLVLKGPEIAARYPHPSLRVTSDLDLLVSEPEETQKALIAAGFIPMGKPDDAYYAGVHHLRPLGLDGPLPAMIEIHRYPNWVEWAEPPSFERLWDASVPSATGVPNVRALAAEDHAIAIAAHSWVEMPLRRIGDLVDVAAVLTACDHDRVSAVATEWELEKLWKVTLQTLDAVLGDGNPPLAMQTWARNLSQTRDRTILETHLRRWFSPFWVMPLDRAIATSVRAVGRDLSPGPTETWANKFARTREALMHPSRSNSEQERRIGRSGIQPRFRRRGP